eukprot:g5389.t1
MRIRSFRLKSVAKAMEPEAEVFCSTALRALLLLHDKLDPAVKSHNGTGQKSPSQLFSPIKLGSTQNKLSSTFSHFQRGPDSTGRELLTLSLLSPMLTERLEESRKLRLKGTRSEKRVDVLNRKYLDHIESCVVQNAAQRHRRNLARNVDFDPCFQLFPFVTHTPVTSAATLASMICYLIERDIPFRRIWPQVETMYNNTQSIRGIRVSCAGRTSRKATKAKTLNARVGSTSLAVFSRDVDYASATADTRHGNIGIKVWIAFK